MTEPLKRIGGTKVFFDLESVPCADTIRKIYGLGGVEDEEAILYAFDKAGATFENPQPFLKTVMHKVVCVSALWRTKTRDGVEFELVSLGESEEDSIRLFLHRVGDYKPQLIGYNSTGFDLTVLYQRAIIHGISIPKFCERPEKPWEDRPDYFSAANAYNVDLCKVVGGWGKETPSLVEMARACGIPAKQSGDGGDVLAKYQQGKIDDIISYCEGDVLTTYQLWLRVAVTCGLLTPEDAEAEREQAVQLFEAKQQGATA